MNKEYNINELKELLNLKDEKIAELRSRINVLEAWINEITADDYVPF